MMYLHVKNQIFQAHKGLKGPHAPTPHETDGERLEPRLLTPSPVAFPDGQPCCKAHHLIDLITDPTKCLSEILSNNFH